MLLKVQIARSTREQWNEEGGSSLQKVLVLSFIHIS